MTVRTSDKTVVFKNPFLLTAVGRVLPAGAYRILTDEELIDGLSFPVYRRLSTVIFIPTDRPSSTEMVQIDPGELQLAQHNDDATQSSAGGQPTDRWPVADRYRPSPSAPDSGGRHDGRDDRSGPAARNGRPEGN